jgi:uncharacterized protein DUF6114
VQGSPRLAFLISLIAGLLIVTGGLFTSLVGILLRTTGFEFANSQVTWPGTLGSGVGLFEFGVGLMGIVGVLAGTIVVLAAVMLLRRPKKRSTWGSLIILFSLFSIYGAAMGGFGIGIVLGLIGGLLAVTWKPKNITP